MTESPLPAGTNATCLESGDQAGVRQGTPVGTFLATVVTLAPFLTFTSPRCVTQATFVPSGEAANWELSDGSPIRTKPLPGT